MPTLGVFLRPRDGWVPSFTQVARDQKVEVRGTPFDCEEPRILAHSTNAWHSTPRDILARDWPTFVTHLLAAGARQRQEEARERELI